MMINKTKHIACLSQCLAHPGHFTIQKDTTSDNNSPSSQRKENIWTRRSKELSNMANIFQTRELHFYKLSPAKLYIITSLRGKSSLVGNNIGLQVTFRGQQPDTAPQMPPTYFPAQNGATESINTGYYGNKQTKDNRQTKSPHLLLTAHSSF